jgi:carboxymethylenebutenolidase
MNRQYEGHTMFNGASEGLRTESLLCPGGMPAFMAVPREAERRLPVVVVLHERYGLVQHTRDLAMRCARDGYLAIAPDLFFKHPDPEALNRGESRCDLADVACSALLRQLLAMLADHPNADLTRVAIAGFCQTGRFPLVFGAAEHIAAAVVWYGAAGKRDWETNALQPRPLEEIVAQVRCPVLGVFGALDHIISIDDVLRLRGTLEGAGKSYEIHVLEKAPHGWLNDTIPGRYRAAEAEAAWAAQQAFLGRVLARGYRETSPRWSFTCERPAGYDFSKNVRLA